MFGTSQTNTSICISSPEPEMMKTAKPRAVTLNTPADGLEPLSSHFPSGEKFVGFFIAT